jgi:hypothetical protein
MPRALCPIKQAARHKPFIQACSLSLIPAPDLRKDEWYADKPYDVYQDAAWRQLHDA